MKNLKLIFGLLITGVITMSMGFPTDLTNDRITDENQKETCSTVSNVVVMTRAASGKKSIEKGPIQELSKHLFSNPSTIALKVFDTKGTLVVNKQVSIDNFLEKSESLYLPTGSIFVMFQEDTVYYFMEAGLIE